MRFVLLVLVAALLFPAGARGRLRRSGASRGVRDAGCPGLRAQGRPRGLPPRDRKARVVGVRANDGMGTDEYTAVVGAIGGRWLWTSFLASFAESADVRGGHADRPAHGQEGRGHGRRRGHRRSGDRAPRRADRRRGRAASWRASPTAAGRCSARNPRPRSPPAERACTGASRERCAPRWSRSRRPTRRQRRAAGADDRALPAQAGRATADPRRRRACGQPRRGRHLGVPAAARKNAAGRRRRGVGPVAALGPGGRLCARRLRRRVRRGQRHAPRAREQRRPRRRDPGVVGRRPAPAACARGAIARRLRRCSAPSRRPRSRSATPRPSASSTGSTPPAHARATVIVR